MIFIISLAVLDIGNIKKKDLIEFIQNEGGSNELGYRQIDMYDFIDRQSRADEQQQYREQM